MQSSVKTYLPQGNHGAASELQCAVCVQYTYANSIGNDQPRPVNECLLGQGPSWLFFFLHSLIDFLAAAAEPTLAASASELPFARYSSRMVGSKREGEAKQTCE